MTLANNVDWGSHQGIDGAVGAETEGHAHIQPGAGRNGALRAFLAPNSEHGIRKGADEGGLRRDHDAEIFFTLQVSGRIEHRVFDAMPRVGARIGFHRRLDGIQRHIDGRIAPGVDGDLESGIVKGAYRFVQVLGLPDGNVPRNAVVGLAGV